MFRRVIGRVALVTTLVLAISNASVSAASAADYRYLQFKHSLSCLEIPGWSIDNSTQADQWECLNQANLQWDLEFVRDDWGQHIYRIVNRHSGKCLDVAGNSTANGARIIQYTCKSSFPANQLWTLAAASTNGTWHWIISWRSSKCINISGASQANGAKAMQWTCGVNAENDQVALWRA